MVSVLSIDRMAPRASVALSLGGRVLRRARSMGRRVLRDLVSLPWHLLALGEQARIVEQLSRSLVSTIDISGGSLRFVASTPLLQARAKSVLTKEPDTIRWIDSFDRSDVFWDVGANVGVFSLYAARSRGVRVLAFEPSADNYM